jgi:hypothetical protein
MHKGKRRWMVAAIHKHLLPTLHGIGFETVPLTADENKGQIRQVYPFGRLRRAREGVLDVAEIAMDTYGRPAFRVDAGTVCAAGVLDTVAGPVPYEQVWSGYLPTSYGLYQVPWLLRKFRVVKWPWEEVSEQDVNELVQKVAEFAPREIDDVLVRGRIGPHIRKWG